jgi:hypothetical protein
MKKLLFILLCSGIALGATAQHKVVGIYHGAYAFRPSIGIGFYSPFYGPYGLPYWGLPYPGYYPYGMGYSRPSNLQRKEEDIRMDYADRIYSVKEDSTLTNKQKRQEIRSLKKERDQNIHELVMNYHKQPAPAPAPQENTKPQDNAKPQDNLQEQ